MLPVINQRGESAGERDIPSGLATEATAKGHVMYRAVHREYANARAGTASTKRRDEVSGGGKKPWRQKGTGRARQGSIRSPQWRHGGVVFGPKPRSFATSLNKKERNAAFVAALATKMQSGDVTLLDAADFEIVKTRDLAALLFGKAGTGKTHDSLLIVYDAENESALNEKLGRSARNLSGVGVTHTAALDVKDLLRFRRLVLTLHAFDRFASAAAR